MKEHKKKNGHTLKSMIYDAVKNLMKVYTYDMYVDYMKQFKPDQPMMTEKEFEAIKEDIKNV